MEHERKTFGHLTDEAEFEMFRFVNERTVGLQLLEAAY